MGSEMCIRDRVISTNCGGPEELIENKVNGTVVYDYSGLVDAMKDYFEKRYIPLKSNKIDYSNLKKQYFEKIYEILRED